MAGLAKSLKVSFVIAFLIVICLSEKCTETAILGGGCFWGIEAALEKVRGVCEAESGYSGGTEVNPHY